MPSQNWKEIGARELARLRRTRHVADCRNILRAAEGEIIWQSLDDAGQKEVLELTTGLLGEFEPGAAIMILRAAQREARRQKTTDEHR